MIKCSQNMNCLNILFKDCLCYLLNGSYSPNEISFSQGQIIYYKASGYMSCNEIKRLSQNLQLVSMLSILR